MLYMSHLNNKEVNKLIHDTVKEIYIIQNNKNKFKQDIINTLKNFSLYKDDFDNLLKKFDKDSFYENCYNNFFSQEIINNKYIIFHKDKPLEIDFRILIIDTIENNYSKNLNNKEKELLSRKRLFIMKIRDEIKDIVNSKNDSKKNIDYSKYSEDQLDKELSNLEDELNGGKKQRKTRKQRKTKKNQKTKKNK